ncbi:MAG: Lrp/AsnC family transcriptional regulator [Pseudomonadota bacterium]
MKQFDLDVFDARILNLLQRDNRMTAQALAEEVGLSPAACQKRLKRLRASGVIEAEVALLVPKAAGIGFMAVVNVRTIRDEADELNRFKQAMQDAPEVTQCYYVTGENNFVLVVALEDTEAYEQFSRKYFIEATGVAHFITNVIMDRVKSSGVMRVTSAESD